jgi:osmotically inducible protein OsmC
MLFTMKRKASAVWQGTIKEGSGHLSTGSTVLQQTQYSFNSRFAEGVGTNPEELLAAAHAGCFTMKLSADLTEAGFTPESLETEATVTFEDGKIALSRLSLKAKVPGIGDGDFQQIAKKSKDTCPVSVAFSFPLELEAILL